MTVNVKVHCTVITKLLTKCFFLGIPTRFIHREHILSTTSYTFTPISLCLFSKPDIYIFTCEISSRIFRITILGSSQRCILFGYERRLFTNCDKSDYIVLIRFATRTCLAYVTNLVSRYTHCIID